MIFSFLVPPSVFIDHDEVTTSVGETVTVHCTANGTPLAQISWYKGRKKIKSNRRIALSSQGHLVINAVQISDQGFYTCLANNIAGQDSLTIVFQVQGKLNSLSSMQVQCKNLELTSNFNSSILLFVVSLFYFPLPYHLFVSS